MGWLQSFFASAVTPPPVSPRGGAPIGGVQALTVDGWSDPALAELLRGGVSAGGVTVNARTVLRNAGVFRCVSLISNTIGMLPFHLMRSDKGRVAKADDHPVYDILATTPNDWQTAFVFRRLMQHRVLVHGNAYALIVRTGERVRHLIPLDPVSVTPKLRDDWTLVYEYRRKAGGTAILPASDVLHLMGPSDDGVKGLSLVDYAAETLGLSLAAQKAAVRTFQHGVSAGGVLKVDKGLSDEALERLRAGMAEYQGPENAGKWIVGEEGLEPKPFGGTAKDNQSVEQRQHQIEEVARIFGVPRPFLMVDDTSWGSGIEQLGIFFVQYGLAPHFVCWEQAVARSLLTVRERRDHYAKFNERALLRGSMKDQAEYFAKALGSGGGRAWMTQDEVRDLTELEEMGGQAAELSMGVTAATGPIEDRSKA